ncbi:MAG: DMT family transporter [Tissierellia bacterium]|nr:DMT family transporter [Tissierellia bacterium]
MNQILQGIILALTGSFLWGLNGNLAITLFDNFGHTPGSLISFRLFFTGLIYFILNFFRKGTKSLAILQVKSNLAYIFLYALAGVMLAQFANASSTHYSNAPTASLLIYMGIFLVTGYLALKAQRWPKPTVFLALFMAILGLAVLITHGDFSSLSISPLALFWGLVSALGYTIANLAPLYLLARYPSTEILAPSMTLSGLSLALITRPDLSLIVWTPPGVALLVFSIIGGTIIPYFLLLEAQKRMGPQLTSAFSLTEAIFSTIIAVLLLNTPFYFLDYVGIGLILLALLILILSQEDKNQAYIKAPEEDL